jgi:hypothetical protein
MCSLCSSVGRCCRVRLSLSLLRYPGNRHRLDNNSGIFFPRTTPFFLPSLTTAYLRRKTTIPIDHDQESHRVRPCYKQRDSDTRLRLRGRVRAAKRQHVTEPIQSELESDGRCQRGENLCVSVSHSATAADCDLRALESVGAGVQCSTDHGSRAPGSRGSDDDHPR